MDLVGSYIFKISNVLTKIITLALYKTIAFFAFAVQNVCSKKTTQQQLFLEGFLTIIKYRARYCSRYFCAFQTISPSVNCSL